MDCTSQLKFNGNERKEKSLKNPTLVIALCSDLPPPVRDNEQQNGVYEMRSLCHPTVIVGHQKYLTRSKNIWYYKQWFVILTTLTRFQHNSFLFLLRALVLLPVEQSKEIICENNKSKRRNSQQLSASFFLRALIRCQNNCYFHWNPFEQKWETVRDTRGRGSRCVQQGNILLLPARKCGSCSSCRWRW